jgi:hypothetical protein
VKLTFCAPSTDPVQRGTLLRIDNYPSPRSLWPGDSLVLSVERPSSLYVFATHNDVRVTAEQLSAAARVLKLESEVEHWRNRALYAERNNPSDAGGTIPE